LPSELRKITKQFYSGQPEPVDVRTWYMSRSSGLWYRVVMW